MSGLTFEQIRILAALALLVVAGIVFLPREGDGEPAAGVGSPEPSIVLGQPGGEVVSSATPGSTASAAPTTATTPAATPAPTPSPTAEPTPAPTPPPVAQDGFSAEILACQSISGSTCNGQLGTLPAGAGSFTALVRFTDANGGDVMNAILTGPSGTIPGGAYALQGGGDGYYYSTFSAGGLAPGDYTLTATRNGEAVAVTTFTRGG